MAEIESITVEAELVKEDATRDIGKAVSARHWIARKYVMRIRRRHPDASPAEVNSDAGASLRYVNHHCWSPHHRRRDCG